MKTECFKFVLNILCVTSFVTSSVAVVEAATWVCDKIMIENQQKRENMEIKEIFTQISIQ